MYNGYTYELSREQQDANELAAVRDMVANHPDNAYWRSVLIALETKLELRNDAEWLDIDPRTAEQIDRDEASADWQQQVTELRGGL